MASSVRSKEIVSGERLLGSRDRSSSVWEVGSRGRGGGWRGV